MDKKDKKDEIILQQLEVIQTLTEHNLRRMGTDFWGPPPEEKAPQAETPKAPEAAPKPPNASQDPGEAAEAPPPPAKRAPAMRTSKFCFKTNSAFFPYLIQYNTAVLKNK